MYFAYLKRRDDFLVLLVILPHHTHLIQNSSNTFLWELCYQEAAYATLFRGGEGDFSPRDPVIFHSINMFKILAPRKSQRCNSYRACRLSVSSSDNYTI